jgi:vacuolar-type H+-ATPase subunit I/STV1
MSCRPLVVALSVAGATGCAAITLSRSVGPQEQLVHAAAALEAQNYVRARELLEPVYYQHWREPVGQQALLMLVAAELDGRNPNRRLWAAADMSARLLDIPQVEPWAVPVAESYYLLAHELGAAEERAALAETARADAEERALRAERSAGRSRELPRMNRETLPAQLRRVNENREQLRRQVDELQHEISERDRELRETRQELERIKRTIKP